MTSCFDKKTCCTSFLMDTNSECMLFLARHRGDLWPLSIIQNLTAYILWIHCWSHHSLHILSAFKYFTLLHFCISQYRERWVNIPWARVAQLLHPHMERRANILHKGIGQESYPKTQEGVWASLLPIRRVQENHKPPSPVKPHLIQGGYLSGNAFCGVSCNTTPSPCIIIKYSAHF